MTARWREYVDCPSCGARVSTEQPFDTWVRNHPQLDSVRDGITITDGDKWVHRYAIRTGGAADRSVQYLMTVEVKTHERRMPPSQSDTLTMVNDLLRTVPWKEQRESGKLAAGHRQNIRVVQSVFSGRRVQLLCYGIHVLRFSGAGPEDSDWMTWDGHQIGPEHLVKLLRFEIHPDSLQIMEHRHHKTGHRQQPLPYSARLEDGTA
jgi:hypothetical protein